MGERSGIAGHYFFAGESRAQEGRLIPLGHGSVRIELADGSHNAETVEAISDRLGRTARRISFVGGASFSTADNDAVDEMIAAPGQAFSWAWKLEAFHPRLILLVIAAIALVFFLLQDGLPLAAKVAAWATPREAVEFMDRSSLSTLDRIVLLPSSLPPGQKAAIEDRFTRLQAVAGPEISTRLFFRDGGALGANALALPGGSLVFTDQLVQLLDAQEIQAVLAHEIAHVAEDHSLQQLYRSLGFAGLVAIIAGDFGAAFDEVIGGGGLLLAMAASREMETDADAYAVSLLRQAGENPRALITGLDKLMATVCPEREAACEETGFLSSHPGGRERREALERAIAETR